MPSVTRLVTDDDFAAVVWRGNSGSTPAKTPEYFRRRYARHPVYRYVVDAIVEADRVVALLASRVAEHEGHRALRLVDFAGPPLVIV